MGNITDVFITLFKGDLIDKNEYFKEFAKKVFKKMEDKHVPVNQDTFMIFFYLNNNKDLGIEFKAKNIEDY